MRLLLFLCFSLLSAEEPFFKELFEVQKRGMTNLEVENPPHLVLFSGTPGMGKTTVAKAIANAFQAVVLSSDEARILFRENGFPRTKLDDYLLFAIATLQNAYPNGRVILDNTVDSCYPPYKNYLEASLTPHTLIRIVMPRELVEERIIKREADPQSYLNALNTWWANYENFALEEPFDLYFDNSSESSSLNPLLEELHEIAFSVALPSKLP